MTRRDDTKPAVASPSHQGEAEAGGGTWWVYLLECADGKLYAGITTDLERRVAQHNGLRRGGARCTRARRPVRLVYAEPQPDRGAATRREAAIKRMPVGDKRALVQGGEGLTKMLC